ncbi:hypothetical protein Tco_0950747, partial [Tanacetum coccineum]
MFLLVSEPGILIKCLKGETRNISEVLSVFLARKREERLDQFVDQFANRINDMMNPRRRGDRNGRRNEGEESENPFFEGDSSYLFAEPEGIGKGWESENLLGKDLMTVIHIFKRMKINVSFLGVVLGVEEESMPVYDTDIEDVIEEEEGFVGKRGLDGEEDNIEDVVVVANDLCSSMIQTTLNVDFEEDINTKSHELMSFWEKIYIFIKFSKRSFQILK